MKIWYSISADGMGHVIRSREVIKELKKNHEVVVTCDNPGYTLLNNTFDNVLKITQPKFIYKNNSAKNFLSMLRLLAHLPRNTICMVKTYNKIKPDLIVTDFEPSAHWAGLIFNKKVVSFGNNFEFRVCKHNVNMYPKYWWMSFGLRCWAPKTTKFIITSLQNAKPRKNNVFVVNPVIRNNPNKSTKGDFVLIYQTTNTNKSIIGELKKLGKAKIYGLNVKLKNVESKKFSDKEFLKDLSSCKYVIVNGGFSVITEAMQAKKPILANPIAGQFEQEYNAAIIEQLGIGRYMKNIDVKSFEKNLSFFQKNVEKIHFRNDMKRIIELIETC